MDDTIIEKLGQLGVVVDTAIARFAGKKERYVKYMKLHAEQNYYSKLLDALASGDLEAAQRYSHTLKGDFRNFEFTEIIPAMVSINEILKKQTSDGVDELIDFIDLKYNNIIDVIKIN